MQAALWNKIEAFPLDSPTAVLPFSAKLAEQNGWDPAFTKLAIYEYRRFLYLCTVNNSVVTPSKVIDIVWHLHLTYTRSYWDDLCRDTLGKKIHHSPSDGSETDAAKYNAAYKQTLRNYTHHFHSVAPKEIWTSSTQTADSSEKNTSKKSSRLIKFALIAFLFIAALIVGSLEILPMEVAVAIAAFLGFFIISGLSKGTWTSGRSGGSSCGSDCGAGCGGD